jgi:hypothetical protein
MKKNAYLFLLLLLAACASDGGSGSSADTSSGGSGQGGSLARFAVVGSYLYTVDEHRLQAFDITDAAAPVQRSATHVGAGIETIFPKDGYLFIGSRIGMFIYDVATPERPTELSMVPHAYSCDPVAVNDRYAFVTLNSASTTCWRNVNELQIISVADKKNPKFLKSYPMDSPQGLGVDDTTLFVCDKSRLKVYGVADVMSIKPKHEFPLPDATDVIPADGLLIAVGSTGLRQYRYAADTITLLSTIAVGN